MITPPIQKPAFERGRLMMTRGISVLMGRDQAAGRTIILSLGRHLAGDCGEMSDEDVLANLRAVLHGGERIFSSYQTSFGKLWIITEADRSATTIMLPEEY
jgi:hypothetical protein